MIDNKLKKNSGITLIALVITIIVMLILVAVTITMAVNGGLFEYAGSAGAQTNTARDQEQEFANLESDMTYDELIDKYTGWTGDSNGGGNTTCEKCVDGYITGYVCENYGKGCDVINKSYVEIENSDSVQLSECLHYTMKKVLQERTFPCPDCSKDNTQGGTETITFSIGEETYVADAGTTWSTWEYPEQVELGSFDGYVTTLSEFWVVKEDGTKVEYESEIINRT